MNNKSILLIPSLFFFVVIALLIWFVNKGTILVNQGLSERLWFVIFLVLGFCMSAMLFAMFKSYARYSGKVLGGKIELGGPGVLMLVIVILGFRLTPSPITDFDVTFLLRDTEGGSPLVSSGKVVVDFDADPRVEKINELGLVRFVNVPVTLLNQSVKVRLTDVDAYQLSPKSKEVKLDAEKIELQIEVKTFTLNGEVNDIHGNFVADATVQVGTTSTQTDAFGQFQITLPGNLDDAAKRLTVSANQFETWRGRFVMSQAPVKVQLLEKRD